MSKVVAPTHDCPIMGKDTEYIRTLNIKTDEYSWDCIYCMMAEKVSGKKRTVPPSEPAVQPQLPKRVKRGSK